VEVLTLIRARFLQVSYLDALFISPSFLTLMMIWSSDLRNKDIVGSTFCFDDEWVGRSLLLMIDLVFASSSTTPTSFSHRWSQQGYLNISATHTLSEWVIPSAELWASAIVCTHSFATDSAFPLPSCSPQLTPSQSAGVKVGLQEPIILYIEAIHGKSLMSCEELSL